MRPESCSISHTTTQAPLGEQRNISQAPVTFIAQEMGGFTSTRDIDWMPNIFLTDLAKPTVQLPLVRPNRRTGSEIKHMTVNPTAPVASSEDRGPDKAATSVQRMFIKALRSARGSIDTQPSQCSSQEITAETKPNENSQIIPAAGTGIGHVTVNLSTPIASPKNRDPIKTETSVQQIFIKALRSTRGSSDENTAEATPNARSIPSAGSKIKHLTANPTQRDTGKEATSVQQMFIKALRSARGTAGIQPSQHSSQETKRDQHPAGGRSLVKSSSPESAIGTLAETLTPLKTVYLAKTTSIKQVVSTKSAPKRPLFLNLPGELRTKIYEMIYETYRVEIIRAKPKEANQRSGRYRLYHRSLPPRDPTTHVIPAAGRNRTPPSPPLGLILTCKSIHYETLLYLYTNAQFMFSSPKTITAFLKRTPEIAQCAIRHLELRHVMYNEPRFTKFREFKCRSDMTWYLACHAMSQSFTSLRVLHLDLAVWDWPIRLELGEKWALPPLFFGRGGGLEYADIKLSMKMFKEEKLKQTARLLEQAIMKPEAYQIKEDERISKELAGPVKAMVLDLTV